MYIYILDKTGQPLMPTKRCRMVRKLLKSGEAKVVKRCPFVVQSLYDVEGIVQDINLGVDAGTKKIGLCATTVKAVLYQAEVELRTDIVKLLASRRELRRTRRSRKTRYREARFLNRRKSKKKGWLPPSIRQKIESHVNIIEKVYKILPISKIIVEVASFDIQKIKNPDIIGKEYQEGEQLGFWNVREYVLFRDGHLCQCCKGKSKDKILETHHIESRETGGDAPNNLVVLCKTCHDGYHAGSVKLPDWIKREASFRDATQMGIMRWFLYDELKEKFDDVNLTYGYITKHDRIEHKLVKTHYNDARCISKNIDVEELGYYYSYKKLRRYNRKIHKENILKGGKRKQNQALYEVFGFCLFDKVFYNGVECFITGRRSSGYFKIIDVLGNVIHNSVSYKKLEFLERSKGYQVGRIDCGNSQFLPDL